MYTGGIQSHLARWYAINKHTRALSVSCVEHAAFHDLQPASPGRVTAEESFVGGTSLPSSEHIGQDMTGSNLVIGPAGAETPVEAAVHLTHSPSTGIALTATLNAVAGEVIRENEGPTGPGSGSVGAGSVGAGPPGGIGSGGEGAGGGPQPVAGGGDGGGGLAAQQPKKLGSRKRMHKVRAP